MIQAVQKQASVPGQIWDEVVNLLHYIPSGDSDNDTEYRCLHLLCSRAISIFSIDTNNPKEPRDAGVVLLHMVHQTSFRP